MVAVRVGAWEFDAALGTLEGPAGTRRLDLKQSELLSLLVAADGQPCSVDHILATVWPGVVVTPQSVYQAVAGLRLHLGTQPDGSPYLVTVKGVGYRLAPSVLVPQTTAVTVAERTAAQSETGSVASPDVPDEANPRLRFAGWRVKRQWLYTVMMLSVAAGLLGRSVVLHRAQPAIWVQAQSAAGAAAGDTGRAVDALRDALRRSGAVRLPATPSSSERYDLTVSGGASHDGAQEVLLTLRHPGEAPVVWAAVSRVPSGTPSGWSDEQVQSMLRRLRAMQVEAPRSTGTGRSGAQAAYQEARVEMAEEAPGPLHHALQSLTRAVALDDQFAAAFAARSLLESRLQELDANGQFATAADADAEQAIRLNNRLADAYTARATRRRLQCDWRGAEQDYARALASPAPDYDALSGYAQLEMATGHLAVAMRLMRDALELQPLSVRGWLLLAQWQMADGQLAEARQALVQVERIDAGSAALRERRFDLALLSGDAGAVRQQLQATAALGAPDHRQRLRALATFGGRVEAQREAARLHLESPATQWVETAELAVALGHPAQAFVVLTPVVAPCSAASTYVRIDPFLAELRRNSRFAEVLRALHLPE